MTLLELWVQYVAFCYFVSYIASIMSGDSPNAHTNNVFDFIDGRQSPTPTTSKDAGTQGLVAASVLVEPAKCEDSDRNSLAPPPNLNESADPDASSKTLQLEDRGEVDGGRDPPKDVMESKERLNAKWVPAQSVKTDEEDESCTVKCLYYAMQCCECTII